MSDDYGHWSYRPNCSGSTDDKNGSVTLLTAIASTLLRS